MLNEDTHLPISPAFVTESPSFCSISAVRSKISWRTEKINPNASIKPISFSVCVQGKYEFAYPHCCKKFQVCPDPTANKNLHCDAKF